MFAAICRTPGDVDDLSVEEIDDLIARPNQVVIDVVASGVNFVDALFVQGKYQLKPHPPFIPGSEVAGVVREIGEAVTKFAIDDRVLASCGLGGFASQVAVAVDQVELIPPNISFAAAASFTQSYCTALFVLEHRVQQISGERVLVLGGGGGVGLAAIQVAKARGATVIATGSTVEKRLAATAAGADVVVDGDPEGLKERVRDLVAGGVDIVIDPIGGTASLEAIRTLREFGRYAVIGFAAGEIPQIPANQVLLRNRSVVGVDWGAWAMSHPVEQKILVRQLLSMVERGALAPGEPYEYRLADAVKALNDLLNRRVVGKAVLVS